LAKYIVNTTIRHKGRRVVRGKTVEMSPRDAARVRPGTLRLVPVAKEPGKAADSKNDATEKKKAAGKKDVGTPKK